MNHKTMKVLVILISILLFISLSRSVLAIWIFWVDCDDLHENNTVTPKTIFSSDEKICFYGAGFPGPEYTITLSDPIREYIRTMTVPVSNGVISSAWGFSLSSIEPGTYMLSGATESNYVCSNQDDNNFCIEKDETCRYYKFLGSTVECTMNKSISCVIDTDFDDPDSDGDGWTDNCDVFPQLVEEQLDWDGDGYGNKIDLYDFDIDPQTPGPYKNITDERNLTGNKTGISSSGGGSRSFRCVPEYECTFWSECIDGKQTRECEIINGCDGEPEETEKTCLLVSSGDNPKPEEVAEQQKQSLGVGAEEPQNGLAAITGAFITDTGKISSRAIMPVIILILIILLIVFRNKLAVFFKR